MAVTSSTSTLTRRCWLGGTLGLVIQELAGDTNYSGIFRGWYVEGSSGPGPFIEVRFPLEVSCTAHLDLTAVGPPFKAQLSQSRISYTIQSWRRATEDEARAAKRRVFFDALFSKRNQGASRMILVHREMEWEGLTYYLEPLP